MNPYDFKAIEKYWQEKWEEEYSYKTGEDKTKKKVYVLGMFPYPSGEGLHVGHARIFSASDMYARMKRMQGYNVLFPTGWDAFGLPAEQFAIKNKIHPRISTDKNINNFRRQMKMLSLSYDFKREVDTTDPAYYKWSQWIFLKLYEKGLAYESYDPINWCPSCQTGLANEDLEGGKCERCGSVVEKKKMRQWTLRITEYADRLLNDLDTLDKWPEWLKALERNWIGKSEGAEFDFTLVDAPQEKVKIFTTRPDTLFGATFVAISAELASSWVASGWNTTEEVKTYITKTLAEQKEVLDYGVEKEKTGIATGIFAINPATNEKIPVWIANYVLGGVGTGAIMAVPAHDERDFDFAKKYSLLVKQVVAPHVVDVGEDAVRPGVETLHRKVIDVILENEKGEILLVIETRKNGQKDIHFIGGGVEEGDTIIETIHKEVSEESGYADIEIVSEGFSPQSGTGFRHTKQKNQETFGYFYHVKTKSDKKVPSEVDQGLHEIGWYKKEEVENLITWPQHKNAWLDFLHNRVRIFTDAGTLVGSGDFDGLPSAEAKEKITAKFGGKKVSRYKLQDWVFSRQRYWGEPIPMVHDEEGKVWPLDVSELPLILPEVEHYEPTGTGESPLALITDWVNVKGHITPEGTFKQSADGKVFKRETNTMPQWAGSSWYYLRFANPENNTEIISKEDDAYWQPVDRYVGGAEHATRHLIYARFWHKFLYDLGVVGHIEPFLTMESVGLVLGPDGAKMSKRSGNVVNPDDVVGEWGSDTVRMYCAFMGSYYDATPWNPKAISGCSRFIERVWKLQSQVVDSPVEALESSLQKTIKKVTEDIESFKFNTAVSALMILVNEIEKEGSIGKAQWKILLQLIAPFAPCASQDLWSKVENGGSVHHSSWPSYDESKMVSSHVTISIQVNGKLRGTLEIPYGISEKETISLVEQTEAYKKYVEGGTPKRVIVIPNKIVNVVI